MEDVSARVQRALDALGVVYEVMACDPELADTAAFCEHYGVRLEDSANAILVVGKSEPRTYACCVVLATTRLDVNGAVRRRLGAKRASFASADETRDLTGMMTGGVTPIGLPANVPVWVDARVLERERVVIGGGDRSSKLLVSPTIFEQLPGTEIVIDLAKEASPT